MRRLYISDTHFGHEAVIRFSSRPFETVEEMDQAMIHNWNRKVRKEDEIYILGDFIYKSKQPPEYYLDQLNGIKHLITGNHDGRWIKKIDLSQYFESVSQIKEITDQSLHLILCHYPMAEWPRSHKGSYHLFGHIHNERESDSFRYYQNNSRMLNAGVDINFYEPVQLNELMANNHIFRTEEAGYENN
jgi:Predicted phosphoesterase or phosphohydrolase